VWFVSHSANPAALVGVAVRLKHWKLHRLAILHDGADGGIGALVVIVLSNYRNDPVKYVR